SYRYNVLLRSNKEYPSNSELCTAVLEKVVESAADDYQIGVSKIFLKKTIFTQLESCRMQTQSWAALTIQKNIRGFITRRNFQYFKEKTVVIQSHIRGHQARLESQ
uniref:Myosin motor domain-containing protein n=1 Tax=Callorhinchus milii TaxID=7868 RepID=A0A4W3JKX4_CALMI